ncbi:MAG: GtrA family protein [Alistipes sp.]|nr:GtrA family protein [Alistipes sp.]MBQ8774856.1 GtrA family protein [Alistipes sp.]
MIQQLLIRLVDWLYIAPVKCLVGRDIFAYGLCGGANMALDTLWYFVIYHYIVAERFIDLGVVVVSPHIASLIVVFPITFFTGFWLNRNIAFRATEYKTRGQLIRYALSVVGSIALNYVCMKLFVEHLHIWPTPSKMLTTVVSVVYSFLAAKYFTFRPRR